MRMPERQSLGLRVAFAVVIVAVVTACGASSATTGPNTAVDKSAGGGGALAPFPSAAPSAAADTSGAAPGGSPAAGALANNLQVVYTGSLDLVVADLQPALAKAKAAVVAAGGYVGASVEANKGDQPVATITYRIPASRWEDTIGALRGLATKVVAEQTQAAEVGSQIVDLEARIRNLRASEAALLDIAKGAGKISDLLEVQVQLTDIRGQIEQLDAQRTRLTDQVAYGTLVTTFGLEIAAVQETARGWNPAKDVDAATATLIGVGQSLVSGAIWFGIVWLPFLLVLAIVALVVRRLYRRIGPRRSASDPIPGWGTSLAVPAVPGGQITSGAPGGPAEPGGSGAPGGPGER
jgi:hypothetical protein